MAENNESLNSRNYVEKINKIVKDANKGKKPPNIEEIKDLFMNALQALDPNKGAKRNDALNAIKSSLSNAEAILGADSETYKELSTYYEKALKGEKIEEEVIDNEIKFNIDLEDTNGKLNIEAPTDEGDTKPKEEKTDEGDTKPKEEKTDEGDTKPKEEKTDEKVDEAPVVYTKEEKLFIDTANVDMVNFSFIERKSSRLYAETATYSNSPSEALANVDDLLMAYKYLVKDNEKVLTTSSNEKQRANADKELTKAKPILDPIIQEQLEALLKDSSSITPDTYSSYIALCKLGGNSALSDKVLKLIAERMIEFDKEKFGGLSAEELNKNYNKAEKDAKKVDPFSLKFDESKEEDKDGLDLNKVVFTDDDGKNLSPKEEKEQKDALASLAQELAAERLAKKGSYTQEELEAEIKKATKEVLWASTPSKDADGNFRVKASAVQLNSGIKFYEVHNFKKRVTQKFKDTKFAKNVTAKVDKLDKKLHKRFGKNYERGKDVAKFVGGIAVGTLKNTALFAAAGLVPGGTVAVIGYNVYKNWKSIGPQLKDPNNNFIKKAALVTGGALSTALSGLGIAGAIGENIDVLTKSGIISPEALGSVMNSVTSTVRMGVATVAATLPNITDAVSLKLKNDKINQELMNAKSGSKKNIEALKNKMAVMDVEIASSSGVMKLYHKLNKLNVKRQLEEATKQSNLRSPEYKLGLKNRKDEIDTQIMGGNVSFLDKMKLQKERKEIIKELDKISKVKSIEELEKERKENSKKQLDNAKQMLSKGAGIFGGMWMAQAIAPAINEQAQNMAEKAEQAVETAHKLLGDGTEKTAYKPLVENSPLQPEPEQQKDYTKVDWEKEIGNNKFRINLENMSDEEVKQGVFRVPDDVSHRAEIADNNLEAASKPESGAKEGMTALEHTKAHLDILSDNRITNTEEFAKGIAGHVGEKADLATIACKMAPYALQAELGLNLPEGANPTTYQMLNYISENELTPEQTEALNKFIDKNFDGGRFKTENFPESYKTDGGNVKPNDSAPKLEPSAHVERPVETEEKTGDEWRKKDVPNTGDKVVDALNDKYATTNDKGSGFKFEPVNDGKAEQPQTEGKAEQPKAEKVEQTRTVVVERESQPVMHEPMYDYAAFGVPPDVWMGMSPQAQEFVASNGLIYDPALSRGIDRIGDAYTRGDGYAGMFINPHERPGGPNQVVIVPNDMLHEEPKAIRMSSALGHQANKTMWYCHKEHDMGLVGVCPDSNHRHSYYGGVPIHNNGYYDKYYDTLGKINATGHTVENMAHVAEGVAHAVKHIKSIFD